MLKYIWILLTFRQVAEAYEAEKGKEKPFYLTRRFIGALVLVGTTAVTQFLGVELEFDRENLLNNIELITASGSAIYGTVLAIVGQLRRRKT